MTTPIIRHAMQCLALFAMLMCSAGELLAYGANGGEPWDDAAIAAQGGPIRGILIRSGNVVDAIQMNYGGKLQLQHGGMGGGANSFDLAPGEYIVAVQGRAGSRINQLVFFLNTGRSSAVFGGNGGEPFKESAPAGKMLVAIAGRSGAALDQISFRWGPIAPATTGAASAEPCLTNNGGCNVNAACATTGPGKFACSCKPGFSGDGIACTAVSACATNNGGCSPLAKCAATGPGSRTCTCQTGYVGDGMVCKDIDECAKNNGGCSADQLCTNAIGGRTCSPKPATGPACTTSDPNAVCTAACKPGFVFSSGACKGK